MIELVDRSLAGETITVANVAAAQQRERATEAYASFTATVMRRRAEAVEHAQEELAEAKHTAWHPVLERAIQMRINAARRADRARLLGRWGTGHTPAQKAEMEAVKKAALDAARPEFDAAREVIAIAVRGGLRLPHNPNLAQPPWPTTEQAERAYWRRPLTAEEFADAAA
jgi:hypothetical protein